MAQIESRVAALGAELERAQEDLGVLVRSFLEGLEPALAPVPSPASGPAEAEPEWLRHLEGLAAADALERWDAIQALGASGDPAAGVHLAPLLGDADLFVRMAAARVLGELRSTDTVPALIDALEDGEPSVREAAVLALRTITGRSFRFDPSASPAERARRVAAWREWWNRSGGAPESDS